MIALVAGRLRHPAFHIIPAQGATVNPHARMRLACHLGPSDRAAANRAALLPSPGRVKVGSPTGW